MDGDGRLDVIVGKMRFAHPHGQPDPDIDATPFLYVFQNLAMTDSRTGGPITLKPFLVDGNAAAVLGTTDAGMGVGRHFSVGHVNTDGIMRHLRRHEGRPRGVSSGNSHPNVPVSRAAWTIHLIQLRC